MYLSEELHTPWLLQCDGSVNRVEEQEGIEEQRNLTLIKTWSLKA